MVAMNFSQDDFDRNATALLSAIALSDRKCESWQLHAYPFALCDWELIQDANGHNPAYMSHSPVTVLSTMSSVVNEEGQGIEFAVTESDDDLEDEMILMDDQCYMQAMITNDKGEPQHRFVTQWTFSILYSATYQTPVLYFYVQEMNGDPVGRQRLLKILRQEHQRSAFEFSNDFPADISEFLSQEEHPITGLPSFFLHPCQSAQRLHLLTIDVKDRIKISKGLKEESKVDDSTKNSVLWIWMSMILPAVGYSIPSSYFRLIQKCIADQP